MKISRKPLTLGLLVVIFGIMGCQAMLGSKPMVPPGKMACLSDYDCPANEYCGFSAIDTYAVCKK